MTSTAILARTQPSSGPNVLRLTPPPTVSPDEVALAISILQEVLT